jgi:hypothetical protein
MPRRSAVRCDGGESIWQENANSTRQSVTARQNRSRNLSAGANTHGLPLQAVGDMSDPDVVLRECRERLQQAYAVVAELRAAVFEQVGNDQTDRCAAR